MSGDIDLYFMKSWDIIGQILINPKCNFVKQPLPAAGELTVTWPVGNLAIILV